MIITYREFGRLANRLFLFAHLIAFSDFYKVALRNFAFREYADSFTYWKGSRDCPYPPREGKKKEKGAPLSLVKMMAALRMVPSVHFWDERDIVFDDEDAHDPRVQKMLSTPTIVFEGWKFRSHRQMGKSMPTIRQVFQPVERIEESVIIRISRARTMGDIVVGVHLRWEDYRGTERFCTLPEFIGKMEELKARLKPNKVAFLICSPERVQQSDFSSNCMVCDNKGPETDLYTLGACDYILGPDSTFSGWASFYGAKPLVVMRRQGETVELQKTRIVTG